MSESLLGYDALFSQISELVVAARTHVLHSVNTAMLQAGYFQVNTKPLPLLDNSRDFLNHPDILEFLGLKGEPYQATSIEDGIINGLQRFLLGLGKGFAFVGRKQCVSTEDQDFYIDLVFYNFKLKCFLLIDLKLGTLTHQDVGQMDTYMRIYDQHRKGGDDNPTIGLVLCCQKSESIVKYSVLTDGEQLFASKYLPTVDGLKRELERERVLVESQIGEARSSYDS